MKPCPTGCTAHRIAVTAAAAALIDGSITLNALRLPRTNDMAQASSATACRW